MGDTPRGQTILKQAYGVVFDCDGCLLDSMGMWRGLEFSLIDMTGVPWTQEMLEEMRAAPVSETAKIFHERHGVMESNEAVVDYLHETIWGYYTQDAALKEGARAFVDALVERSIPCCVVSSTPEKYLREGLGHVGLLDAFAAIVSTQETGISKQDPAIYRLACDAMGVELHGAWGFDDSLYAIRVMKGCGMHAVGTYDADDAGRFDELDDAGDFAIRSFNELL